VKRIRHMSTSRDWLLHIETEGGIINVSIGLTDLEGRPVTSVEVIADDGWTRDGFCNTRLIQG